MHCILCKEEINEDATVCKHCGAYAVETNEEVVWYRQGDSPSRVAFDRWWPWAAAAAVLIAAVFMLAQQNNNANDKARDLRDCIEAGEADC